jgi:hypothetical protein
MGTLARYEKRKLTSWLTIRDATSLWGALVGKFHMPQAQLNPSDLQSLTSLSSSAFPWHICQRASLQSEN